MAKKNYTVKITGSGTMKEIELALLSIANELGYVREGYKREKKDPPEKINWEDPILMTEIREE